LANCIVVQISPSTKKLDSSSLFIPSVLDLRLRESFRSKGHPMEWKKWLEQKSLIHILLVGNQGKPFRDFKTKSRTIELGSGKWGLQGVKPPPLSPSTSFLMLEALGLCSSGVTRRPRSTTDRKPRRCSSSPSSRLKGVVSGLGLSARYLRGKNTYQQSCHRACVY